MCNTRNTLVTSNAESHTRLFYTLCVYLSCRDSLPEIKHKASEARRMLDTWKQAYLDVRKKIEQSGRDARWEFDRKKLFERSDYITQICSDIHDVVQV